MIGKEADAAYALCEQALAIDPNNVRALLALGVKFFMLAPVGVSGDPKGDLERADELESKALALDPDWTWPHDLKGGILRLQARYQEAVAEHERALALDPSNVDAAARRGHGLRNARANSTKALNISTRRFWGARTIRRSPIGMAARRGPISG